MARRIEVPNEDLLPPGPARRLIEELHQLYRASGRLGLRSLSDRIRDNNDLPATVSHETIRQILGGSPARWPTIQALVWTLAANAHPRRDPDAEVERFLYLWDAADNFPRDWEKFSRDRTVPVLPGEDDGSSSDMPRSATVTPRRLDDVLLNTVILVHDSTDLSDVLDPCFAAAPREENRAGWQLFGAGCLNFGAQENWELRHRGHKVGYLLWTRDKHGDRGWELVVPDGYWFEAGQDSAILSQLPYRYISAPPAKGTERTADRGRRWADPADLLAALANWHYCPRTAVTTLFGLVEEGISAEDASRTVHLIPSVGETPRTSGAEYPEDFREPASGAGRCFLTTPGL